MQTKTTTKINFRLRMNCVINSVNSAVNYNLNMADQNVKNETRATTNLNFSKLPPPPLFLLAGMSVGWWTVQQSGIQKNDRKLVA